MYHYCYTVDFLLKVKIINSIKRRNKKTKEPKTEKKEENNDEIDNIYNKIIIKWTDLLLEKKTGCWVENNENNYCNKKW